MFDGDAVVTAAEYMYPIGIKNTLANFFVSVIVSMSSTDVELMFVHHCVVEVTRVVFIRLFSLPPSVIVISCLPLFLCCLAKSLSWYLAADLLLKSLGLLLVLLLLLLLLFFVVVCLCCCGFCCIFAQLSQNLLPNVFESACLSLFSSEVEMCVFSLLCC